MGVNKDYSAGIEAAKKADQEGNLLTEFASTYQARVEAEHHNAALIQEVHDLRKKLDASVSKSQQYLGRAQEAEAQCESLLGEIERLQETNSTEAGAAEAHYENCRVLVRTVNSLSAMVLAKDEALDSFGDLVREAVQDFASHSKESATPAR